MMGQLRRLEKRLEKIFEGPFAKAFKGGVHPLEIARRLMKEVEDGRVLGLNETLAPNRFLVRLSPRDHERLVGLKGSLTAELEPMIIDYSNRRGYHLIARPHIEFKVDGSLREGEFSVAASLQEHAKTRPAGGGTGVEIRRSQDGESPAKLTVIRGEKSGYSWLLEEARTGIGRGGDNLLVLSDPLSSRFHAEIERTASGYIIRDLGSTNGTVVGGRRVSERLLEDGDIIVIGGTELRFDLLDGMPG